MDLQVTAFIQRLAELGPDFSAWPAAEADAAIELMRSSVDAQDEFIRATREAASLSTESADEDALASAVLRRIASGKVGSRGETP